MINLPWIFMFQKISIQPISQNRLLNAFIFCLFACLPGAASGAPLKPREYWPTIEWKTSTPERQGMDSAKLRVAEAFIRERLPDAFSLLVVKNGYLVFEKYYSFGSPYQQSTVHSVTKASPRP